MKVIKEKENNSRRDFLGTVLKGGFIAWAGAIIYPVYNFLEPPKQKELKVSQLNIGKVDDMVKDSGKIVKFGKKPVLVIRKSSGEYAAFNATCTHLDCLVQYRADYNQIYCACHNGRYDLNGKNVSGPPPAPLEKYSVQINKDEVIIYKDAG